MSGARQYLRIVSRILVGDEADVHPDGMPPDGLRVMRTALPTGKHQVLVRKRVLDATDLWYTPVEAIDLSKLVFLYVCASKRVRFNLAVVGSSEVVNYFAGTRFQVGDMGLATDVGIDKISVISGSGTTHTYLFTVENLYAGETVEVWSMAVLVA